MIPFSGSPLDRASEKRGDRAWVESMKLEASSFILPYWRLQPFVRGDVQGPLEAAFLRPGLAEPLAGPDAVWVLLGLDGAGAYFALDMGENEDPTRHGPLAGLGRFTDMRTASTLLPLRDTAILGQGKALIDWHQRHRFCARCGGGTEAADAGYKRVCNACRSEHFPRTDPVVIMLATEGDACLLGRGRNFPAGMYSALAGFIEPGETIEEAVRRELREESGVETAAVQYFATQPWPFPSSLMIGCFAEATSREIKLDDNELSDAIWLEREKVRRILDGDRGQGLWLPPPIAIAHHLLRKWADG